MPPNAILSELATRSEFQPAEVPPALVRRSRCAVGRFLGFAVFPRRARGKQLSSRTDLSSSLALRQSITQRTLANRPKPADSSHGLCIPSAHEGSEIHLPQAYHTCYVPPSGFGYPLGGLRPPSPCRFCFAPAALMGFALRSFPLSQGIHTSPWECTHIPFHLPFLPPPKRRAGPAGRGFWASTLARVPGGSARS